MNKVLLTIMFAAASTVVSGCDSQVEDYGDLARNSVELTNGDELDCMASSSYAYANGVSMSIEQYRLLLAEVESVGAPEVFGQTEQLEGLSPGSQVVLLSDGPIDCDSLFEPDSFDRTPPTLAIFADGPALGDVGEVEANFAGSAPGSSGGAGGAGLQPIAGLTLSADAVEGAVCFDDDEGVADVVALIGYNPSSEFSIERCPA